MSRAARRTEDWVLIHAWIEPGGGPRDLRIRMRRPLVNEGPDEWRRGFTDPEEAAAYVRDWLHELQERALEQLRNGGAG